MNIDTQPVPPPSGGNAGSRPRALWVLTAGILWGFMSLYVRSLSALGLVGLPLVFCRMVLSAALMLVVCLATDRGLLRVRVSDLWVFAGTGLLSMVFFNWCYFTAIGLANAGTAAVLLYTSPVWVMLFGRLLSGEPVTLPKLTALALIFTSVYLLNRGPAGDH